MSELFERAKKVMPGGVNSPVRSFKSVGQQPIFIKSANGSKIYDIDGNEYIDYICSWGPMILGHNNPVIAQNVKNEIENGLSFGAATEKEVIMAELITSVVPNIDMVRMVNSGTEAVMSAIRLARGFTKKDKIIKFDGCYHGHTDSMLVKAGSGAVTFSNPDSFGVTKGQSKDTLIAQFNDIQSVELLFKQNKNEIAAIIIEPVAANMGLVLPKDGFLEKLRELCDKNNALLIFDEVITGFRLCIGGAQQFFNINADIVTFGKIIGGGMPVGAYGARKEIMELVSPLGGVYQAGTLSGNPIAMTAGISQLSILKENGSIYDQINKNAKLLADGFQSVAQQLNAPISINQIGSLIGVFFTKNFVFDFNTAKSSDTSLYSKFFSLMIKKGINIAPSQFEAIFISNSHTVEDIEKTIDAIKSSLVEMKEEGFF